MLPLLAAVFIGIAVFVALSRVLRGSHFPSDVFGGWVLGTVSGMVAANPWKDWIRSVESAMYHAAIGTVWGFSLFWSLAFAVESGPESLFLIGVGALLVVVGVLSRIRARWSGQIVLTTRSAQGPIMATALGLSLMSMAPIVMAAVGLLCVALWLRGEQAPSVVEESCWIPVLRECELAAAVLLSLAVLVAGRGVLPWS